MTAMPRRDFLACSGRALLSTGLAAFAARDLLARDQARAAGPQVVVFTKSFQDRSIAEVCRMFAGLGLDGLDLTVRPGGHIDPKDVETELPKAVEAAQAAGVSIPLLTTSITDADAEAERLLKTAGSLGIRRIKMGYYRYHSFGTLREQIEESRSRLAAVAELAGKFGVLPCVHIHSGSYIPSHGTLLYELLRTFKPGQVGAYVDTLHMSLEGGSDGWRQGLDLLAPYIQLCAVKNYRWEPTTRDKLGKQQWRHFTVPVADGISPIDKFVSTLRTIGFQGVYSLHSEYKGRSSFEDLDTDGCLQQTAKDLEYFRQLL